MNIDREMALSMALARADFEQARSLAKWTLRLDCGHEMYTCLNPRHGLGRGYCNRPGCSLSPAYATQRMIVGTRRITRRERRRARALSD